MIKAAFLLLLFCCSCNHALAQFGQCDPLNTSWFQSLDAPDYPTLEDVCQNPNPPQKLDDCGEIGAAFVTYTDMAILDDGTIQAFGASQDLSRFSATADVQTGTTLAMRNGTQLTAGNSSRAGFAMAHITVPVDTDLTAGNGTVTSQHELNWPGCDGDGIIESTSLEFTISFRSGVYSCSRKGGATPYIGTCTYTCGNGQKSGTFAIPLYRIQKSCPPARNTCPVSLDAQINDFDFGDVDIGLAIPVANSCIYGTVQ